MTNLKNLLLENYSKYFDDLLSGEQSLPFGILVMIVVCTVYLWVVVYLIQNRTMMWSVKSLRKLLCDDLVISVKLYSISFLSIFSNYLQKLFFLL